MTHCVYDVVVSDIRDVVSDVVLLGPHRKEQGARSKEQGARSKDPVHNTTDFLPALGQESKAGPGDGGRGVAKAKVLDSAAKPYYFGYGNNVEKYGNHYQRYSGMLPVERTGEAKTGVSGGAAMRPRPASPPKPRFSLATVNSSFCPLAPPLDDGGLIDQGGLEDAEE